MRCLIALTQLSRSLTAPHDANYVVSPCLVVVVGPYIGLQGVCSLWVPQHLAQRRSSTNVEEGIMPGFLLLWQTQGAMAET